MKLKTSIVWLFFLSVTILLTACGKQPKEPVEPDTPTPTILVTFTPAVTEPTLPPVDTSVYMNPEKPITERVQALLSQMTLAEKVAQMVQPEQNEAAGGVSVSDVTRYGIGSVLSGGGSAPASGNTISDWQNRVLAYREAARNSRLGIPLIYGIDAVHGNNNVTDAVIFPHNIGLGAAADTDLTERIGAAVAEEIRAAGILWTFAPTLGNPYNERWGRTYECFGEDSVLVAELGAAYIRGLQGISLQNGAIATAKHYIGEGQTENGINQGNVSMSAEEFDKLLETELLTPYREAIIAGVRSVMVSYNSVDNLKCHENYHLITEVLKGELGFSGIVVSDYNGIDQISGNTYADKVRNSVNAGIDMFMEPYDWRSFIRTLESLVKKGEVSMERVDDAVTRILTVKYELGLFDKTTEEVNKETTEAAAQFGSSEHRALACEAVRKSLVLLKNDKPAVFDTLKNAACIQVAGRKADDIGVQCGGWTISWQGAEGDITEGTTILEGIRSAVNESTVVEYSSRGKVSENAEAVLVVLGETPYAESNGDSTASALKLSAEDRYIWENVQNTVPDGVPVILILLSGRPITIAEEAEAADAVIAAWLPGSQGEGIAEMLFGDYDFTGTLKYTWPWYASDIDAKFTDTSKVMFSVGTGLKKDGSSILPNGTKTLGTRPEAPADTASFTAAEDGIDLTKSAYLVEAEWKNENSYLVETKTEGDITYVGNWNGQWANTKWNVFIPSSGSYILHFKIAAVKPVNGVALYYNTPAITDDGNANRTELPIPASKDLSSYSDVTLSVDLFAGLYEFKLMATTAGADFRLDCVTFEPVDVTEASLDSTPQVYTSQGIILQENAVSSYATKAIKPGDACWYKYPPEISCFMTELPKTDITTVDTQDIFTLNIDPETTFQTMLGIGTSMEESSINHLKQLTPEVRREFIRYLLDKENGVGMSLFRLTIGTADFTAVPFYTYYDAAALTETNTVNSAPDWYNVTGNGFSIQKDIDYQIIAIVQEILATAKELGVEDEVHFFASSWTPPGWMKEPTVSSQGYADNDLLLKGGKLSDAHIDDLAMYYVRYLEEYKKLGIDIIAITLQNEPMLEIDYPSCAMTGVQEGKLAVAIRNKLAQSELLKEQEILLWGYDHNPDQLVRFTKEMFSVEGAKEAISGIAVHDYSDPLSAMQELADTVLDSSQTVALTERSVWGTQGADRILQYFKNGAVSYNAWVTMLDSKISTHQWVGTPGPTLFVRDWQSTHDYWATPEVGIIGQFSRFLRPGSVRIACDYGNAAHVTAGAWLNAEGNAIVVVLVNQTVVPQPVKLLFGEKQVLLTIDKNQVVTCVIPWVK